jgi:hypothetical protein
MRIIRNKAARRGRLRRWRAFCRRDRRVAGWYQGMHI